MTGSAQEPDCVIADRGGIVENTHGVHVSVVDSNGKLLYAVGDPYRMTLMRSAAKPAQALATLETGCVEQYGFDQADVALMCASHNSEERHVQRARSMLAKARLSEDVLQCGGHPSISSEVNRTWIKADHEPTPINNNCSGKHAGMLAGALVMGDATDTYHLPANSMQLRVKNVVEDLTGLGEASVKWSTDGCNLPAPATPLHNMACMYCRFASAVDDKDADDSRTRYMAQIFNAMTSHPEMVAGKDRFCTKLITAYGGMLIGKVGAYGCYGMAVRASEQTKQLGSDGAIGIAIKIEDGSMDLVYSVAAEILERLQIVSEDTRREVDAFHHLKRLNTMGVEAGKYRHAYQLRPCAGLD